MQLSSLTSDAVLASAAELAPGLPTEHQQHNKKEGKAVR